MWKCSLFFMLHSYNNKKSNYFFLKNVKSSTWHSQGRKSNVSYTGLHLYNVYEGNIKYT